MAHKHILDLPIHCRFLAASVGWEIVKLAHTGDQPWFRPRLARRVKAMTIDPWEARTEFLKLPLSDEHPRAETATEALLDFLDKVGLWQQPPYWEVFDTPRADYQEGILDTGQFVYAEPMRDLNFFRETRFILNDLMHCKAEFRELFLRSARPRNLADAERVAEREDLFSLAFDWGKAVPKPTITTVCFWSAVLLSLQIDHATGATFRSCARPDCGIPYPLTNRHKRKYCSQYCGHLESLRRQRGTTAPIRRAGGRTKGA